MWVTWNLISSHFSIILNGFHETFIIYPRLAFRLLSYNLLFCRCFLIKALLQWPENLSGRHLHSKRKIRMLYIMLFDRQIHCSFGFFGDIECYKWLDKYSWYNTVRETSENFATRVHWVLLLFLIVKVRDEKMWTARAWELDFKDFSFHGSEI